MSQFFNNNDCGDVNPLRNFVDKTETNQNNSQLNRYVPNRQAQNQSAEQYFQNFNHEFAELDDAWNQRNTYGRQIDFNQQMEATWRASQGNAWADQHLMENSWRSAPGDRWANQHFEEQELQKMESVWQNTNGPEKSVKEITNNIVNIQDNKLQNTEFMKLMKGLNNGDLEINKQENTLKSNAGEEYAEDFINNFVPTNMWLTRDRDVEQLKSYIFEQENEFLNTDNTLEEGKRLFHEGRLPEAIRAFEAVLRQDSRSAEAWQLLGSCHAENDSDERAIACLMNSLEVDDSNSSTLMQLGTCYTNHSEHDKAINVLEFWLESHPIYSSEIDFSQNNSVPRQTENNYKLALEILKDRVFGVAKMYEQVAQTTQNNPDPEVHQALGVLYNITGDYGLAAENFKIALQKNPEDHLLWNKLGATLANFKDNEAAIDAYQTALDIKPSYIRATSNIAISLLQMERYEEACTVFLKALSLLPEAEHIWHHLTAIFLRMGNLKYIEIAKERDVNLFRDKFNFDY